MRIRRPTDAPLRFQIRALFGLVTFSAIAMWWGAFAGLLAIACSAVHYLVLAALAVAVTRMNPAGLGQQYRRWRFVSPDDGSVLRMCATVYLIFSATWHLFFHLMLIPPGFPLLWDVPALGRLTLAQIEHFVLIAFWVLLVTSFLSRAYAGDRYSRRVCIETSTLLTLLLASHLVIP